MPGGLKFRPVRSQKNSIFTRGFQYFFASNLKTLIPMQRGNHTLKSRHLGRGSADLLKRAEENSNFFHE